MTFAQRFNIKTSLEEIKEDVATDIAEEKAEGEVAAEGDTVDVLEASTPVVEEPAPVDAPVEPELVEPVATDGDTPPLDTEEAPVDAPVEEAPVEEAVEEPPVEEVPEEAENISDEIEEYDEQIEVATEAIALLGKLNTAIESSVEQKVSQEVIDSFAAIAVEGICSALSIPSTSKVYPSLESVSVESVSAFADKITASTEIMKINVENLRTSIESEAPVAEAPVVEAPAEEAPTEPVAEEAPVVEAPKE